MMMMMQQNQQKVADLEKKLAYKNRSNKGKGKGKKAGKKSKKSEYTVAQKIAYYNANPAKWQSKGEGMVRAGIISGYLTPEQWFHSDVYKAQKGVKGKGPGPGGMTFVMPPQAGVQGGLTQTFIANSPQMTPLQAGVQNPAGLAVHASSG